MNKFFARFSLTIFVIFMCLALLDCFSPQVDFHLTPIHAFIAMGNMFIYLTYKIGLKGE